MDLNEQCCQRVNDRGVWHRAHQCPYKGVIERDGKRYCRIHDPVKVLERRTVREEKWEADYRARADQYARSSDVVRAATAREKVLREAVEGLVTRLDEVIPAIDTAFVFQKIHGGGPYTGATLEEPLATARAALAAFQAQGEEEGK